MVDLKGIVQRKGVDVDDLRFEACLRQQLNLVLHQIALGGYEEHVHLQALALGIEDLKIELNGFDVERHVLLPTNTEARKYHGFAWEI